MAMKIAFAGLSHNHGRSFLRELLQQENVSVVGVYDDFDTGRATEYAAEFACPIYGDLDELFAKSGADTLLTADVNAARPDKIVRALDAGLNVITDKPMATTLEDLDRIEQALLRNPARRLFLMLTERYTSIVWTGKSLIDAGYIGRVSSMIFERPHRLGADKRGAWMFNSRLYGGILNDIGVHDVDLARNFAGCEVQEVLSAFTANRANPRFTDFEDCGQALLRMADGSAAYVQENWFTPDAYPAHGEVRFLVTGTEGQIEMDVVKNTVTAYNHKQKPHKVRLIVPPVSCAEDAVRSLTDPMHKPLVTETDAIRATRAALVAQSIAWENL